MVIAYHLDVQAFGGPMEFRCLAILVTCGLELQAREVDAAAVVFAELERRELDLAVDIAAIAQADLRGDRRLFASGGEPGGREIVFLQRTVAGGHHRHQFQCLDSRPGERTMFDTVGETDFEVERLTLAEVDVLGLEPVLRRAGEEVLLNPGQLDGHAAARAEEGFLQLGIANADRMVQLRGQPRAGVPGPGGDCDGNGDSQAGKDAY